MLLRCWRLEHVQGGLPKTWGEREVGGDWGQVRGMLLAWVLWRAEGRTGFLPCAAVAALLAKPPLGTCPRRGGVSFGNSAGSLWVCCNVLSCRVRQQEALAPSKGPSPAQDSKGDALAAYMSCPLGLCAKPFWDGQEMTQRIPNCEALAGRASSCFAFSDSGVRRSLTVCRHWRFLQGTLAVLSPSSASHQQRGRRNKGGLLMCLS